MFIPLIGFTATLSKKLSIKDLVLPLDKNNTQFLFSKLGNDNTTRLVVRNATGYEIIKVVGFEQGEIMIERAQEGTDAIAAMIGSCISFAWTAENLADFINEGMGGRTPAVLEVKSANDCITVSNDSGVVTITKPELSKTEWRSGNELLTQGKCGGVTSKPVAAGEALQDGEYENATITVKDGHIVKISSGTNIVYSGGGCCTCAGEEDR